MDKPLCLDNALAVIRCLRQEIAARDELEALLHHEIDLLEERVSLLNHTLAERDKETARMLAAAFGAVLTVNEQEAVIQ